MANTEELVVVNRQAWGRANLMLKVAARYIRTPGYSDNRIVYDHARCDGYCLADDLDAAEMHEEPPPGVPVLTDRALPRWTRQDVLDMWRCLRVNNQGIPDEVLDYWRDWALANCIEKRGSYGGENASQPRNGG